MSQPVGDGGHARGGAAASGAPTGRARRSWGAALGLALALVLVPGLAGCGTSAGGDGGPLLVAAASDLRPAFEELGRRFEETQGTPVTFSFGSSGQLAQQIVNGAPFDLFASANEAFADQVVDAGRGDAGTRYVYGVGRLVVWARDGAAVGAAPIEALADPAFRRIAVANPDHAPYGAAAMEALEAAGVLGPVGDRLVYGENISDTQRLVQSGNAEVGVIALSLALAASGGTSVEVPADLHAPLRQALVVTATAARRPAAQAFADLVASGEGRRVLARYGFEPPDDEQPADDEPADDGQVGG
jgi:molybdate transport system substrate-binding protein